MFFDVFETLCQGKGQSPNAVAKQLHISSGAVSEWKKGRVPQNATLKKISDYFGVSIDFLLGRTNVRETEIKNAAPQIVKRTVYSYEGEDGLGTEEQIFDKSKAKPLNELMKSAKTLSHEQINLLTAMAKNMKDNS